MQAGKSGNQPDKQFFQPGTGGELTEPDEILCSDSSFQGNRAGKPAPKALVKPALFVLPPGPKKSQDPRSAQFTRRPASFVDVPKRRCGKRSSLHRKAERKVSHRPLDCSPPPPTATSGFESNFRYPCAGANTGLCQVVARRSPENVASFTSPVGRRW